MSRTVGKHWPQDAPRGGYKAICGYCGAAFHSWLLRLNRDGVWACPSDQKGRDRITLDEGNIRGARAGQRPRVPMYAPVESPETDVVPS